jgi:O-antigen/teichoic acid export membrane protein
MDKIKNKSKNLMHILFPVTMLTMFFTRWIYPRLFAPEFHVSAGVFMVYLLLIIPRVVFPHTILIGRKRTKVTMVAALIELVINIPLSLLMIRWGYGIVGVAVATLIVYIISRIILVVYLWMAMNIKPKEYIPVRVFLIYSALITLLFVLIDHRIIDFH